MGGLAFSLNSGYTIALCVSALAVFYRLVPWPQATEAQFTIFRVSRCGLIMSKHEATFMP